MTTEYEQTTAEPPPRPLKLSELSIRRFRSLENVGPLPLQHDMTVMTGENDGGKTATLDALALLLGDYTFDSADRSHWMEDEVVEVEGLFYAMDDDERQNAVRIRVVAEPSGNTQHQQRALVHTGFGAHPEDIPLPSLRQRMEELGVQSPGGQEKAPYLAACKEWLATRDEDEFEEQWSELSTDNRNRLPNLTRFDSVAAPSPISHVKSVVGREARRLLSTDGFSSPLGSIGQDLDEAIRPSLEYLTAAIREYCPDLEAVELEPIFDFSQPRLEVRMQVKREGALFDLEKAGEGRRRRVALAVHKANLRALGEEDPSTTEFIIYDEPDTHLDYGSQRDLFEILRRQAELSHVQVVVATHSLNFIDKVPFQALLHYRLRNDLRTEVERLSSLDHADEVEFLASVCAGLGLRNSILLDERCFLIVEGDTEEAALPILYRRATGRSFLATGVSVLNTKGSRAVRQLVGVLAGQWGRTVVVLADSDMRDAHSSWVDELNVDEGSTLFYVGEKEFEDAFSNEAWLRSLEADFPPAEGEDPWMLEELKKLREEGSSFGEDLRNLARKRCRDHTIGKPDLGVSLARRLYVDELPEVMAACFNGVAEAAG